MMFFVALIVVLFLTGILLTHDADRLAKKKNLPETPDSIMAHQGIGAVAIVVIILVIVALAR